MNKEENCVFCNIAEGKIPSAKVYEDDKILAFLDVSPTSKGHTLVITKEHFANFLMVPKDLLAQAFDVAQKIGQAMVANLGAKGINILTNVNEIAGQSVMHFHVHLIPRYSEDDAVQIAFHESEKQDLDALKEQLQYK